jgi:hypothetical protein
MLLISLERKKTITRIISDQVSSGQAKGNEIVLDKLEMFSNYSFRIKAHTQV